MILLSCGHMEETVFVYWFPSQTVQFWPGNEVVEEVINFISYASRYQLIIDQFTCMSLRYFLLEIYCPCKAVLQCCIIKQILIGRLHYFKTMWSDGNFLRNIRSITQCHGKIQTSDTLWLNMNISNINPKSVRKIWKLQLLWSLNKGLWNF